MVSIVLNVMAGVVFVVAGYFNGMGDDLQGIWYVVAAVYLQLQAVYWQSRK